MTGRLTRRLRGAARACAVCAVCAAFYSCWLAGRPAARLWSAGAARRWRRFMFRRWARAAARAVGMRVRFRGEPPRAPFLLVANHLGYADVLALASQTGCVFVAKSEVARWPVVGFLCRSVGTLFVNRGRRRDLPGVLASLEREIAAGEGVVLFAEGTSTRGESVLPFKPSLLESAAAGALPVHYASLSYATRPGEPPASEAVCWWGDMTFPRHFFGLCQLGGFEVEMVFGERPVVASDRKALAAELRAAVSAQFRPVAAPLAAAAVERQVG